MALRGTKATTSTTTHAVVQAVESYIQNQNLLGEIAELDDMLCDLVDLHKDNLLALKRVLQCIYNLLQSNSRWNVQFGQKLFHKLISVVIADSRDDSGPRRQLVANVLVCVHLHTKKFRHMDGKFLLYQLWSLSQSSEEQPHAIQILVYLFDDFVQEFGAECYGQLVNIIQNLLQSAEIEHRKSAYFLMAKLLAIIQREKNLGFDQPEHVLKVLQCSESQWSAYVTLMENLEEQQSHLVLPSLSSLLPRLHVAGGHPRGSWLTWLRILYTRLLQDNNILVLRWTLMYFLTRFDLSQLVGLNLLDEFLKATNRTQLFNVEGDVSLIEFRMESFLTNDDLDLLLKHLAKVSWHCVPLVYWLHQVNPQNVPAVSKSVLLELSSRVRTLQNPELRQLARHRILELFENTINRLSLGDFMMFIDALYNTGDDFQDHERLIEKIRNCEDIANDIVRFNQRSYEIVCPSLEESYHFSLFGEFLKKCESLHNSQHGWWRLVPLFARNKDSSCSSRFRDFYRNNYNLEVSLLDSFSDLKSLQLYVLDKLNCASKEEKSFVLQSCVDYFVEHANKWEMLTNHMDLLDKGTERTLVHLVKLLLDHNKPLLDENVLPSLISVLNTKSSSENVIMDFLQYASKFMDPKEYEALVSELIDNCKELSSCVPVSLITKQLLHGETTTGDARIEAAYIDALTKNFYKDVFLHEICIGNVRDNLTYEEFNYICGELLNINNEMSKKKPRYFENSKEHRIKVRIARSLLLLNVLRKEFQWSDNLWEALLEASNQLNICYMYEYLVAYLLPSDDVLFERLHALSSLKPTQQVSLISVVHIYFMLHTDILENRLENIIDVLLPHTMGPHFQTRLLAQLVLYRLASKSNDLAIANAVIKSIKVTLGDKFDTLQKDPRLMLPEIVSNHGVDALLYITNTPFDERYFPYRDIPDLNMALAAFKARRKVPDAELSSLTSTTNGNVQRKMNPCCDIYPNDDLAKTLEQATDHELIVVASLIDKLPNLGGLARTCEIFGVKTLMIASRSDADKSDFANISMTAEKTLNIEEVKPLALGEFLIAKQMEGYKIVGAEQTAHSTSFADFRFPKKCVLLLGHEKHGIPVDLIGFLDYAVEIPQFGMVRSLNVHVTGSLFIWEFCKQHMVKK